MHPNCKQFEYNAERAFGAAQKSITHCFFATFPDPNRYLPRKKKGTPQYFSSQFPCKPRKHSNLMWFLGYIQTGWIRSGRRKRPAVVDCFCSVFDLENAAIGRESGYWEIITSSYAAHDFWVFLLLLLSFLYFGFWNWRGFCIDGEEQRDSFDLKKPGEGR